MEVDADALKAKCAPHFTVTEYPDVAEAEQVLAAKCDKHAFALYTAAQVSRC